MKSVPAIAGVIVLLGCAVLALAFFAPLAVPYYQDFSVMYFTGKALLHGIPIYDYPTQLTFVEALTPAGFNFFPYPYPPWYALSTLFLAWLPVQVAARVWFFLNIIMVSLSAWLATSSILRSPLMRGLLVAAALLFFPALGLMVVGQYSAPVLLGAVLFVFAAEQEPGRHKPYLLAAGLLLLTLKPHIGGLLFLAGFFWLLLNRSPFARRALWLTIIGGCLLLLLGFLADPAWPLTYFQSLLRYRDLSGVQTCGLCASLSVVLIRLATGQAQTASAAWLSLVLAIAAGSLLLTRFRVALRAPFFLMSSFAVLTLMVDPYLLNYDYVLLLLPLFRLVGRAPWFSLLIYLAPWGGLFLGRDLNNILLAGAAIMTFVLICRNSIVPAASGIDSFPGEAYNHIDN